MVPVSMNPQTERAQFFQALLGDQLPDGLWAHVWHVSPKHTDWIRTVEQAEQSATRNGRHDVYMSVGLAGSRGKPTERLRQSDAAGLLGLVADIDIAHDAHKQTNLPSSTEEALAFIDMMEFTPTCIVSSGHGLHVWWLFNVPWRFADDREQRRAMQISTAWQQHLSSIASLRGWKLDNVGDLSRVLRVPGTLNAKKRLDIVPVQLIRLDESARYTPERFAEYCAATLAGVRPTRDNPSVLDGQRFSPNKPCPICNGYEEMRQGIGERCWGFLGRDGISAYCTREEYAGELAGQTTSIGSVVYRHQLYGACECGVQHATAPQGEGPKEGEALWSAQYFVRLYGDVLRFVPTFNRWYESNGRWWEPDATRAALRLGYEAVAALYRNAADEPDHARKAELARLAVRLDKADKIAAMVHGGSAQLPIASYPNVFDTNDWHVVAANGIIDLTNGKLLPHNVAAMHSRHLGGRDSIVYDPLAECPNWLAFLHRIFPEEHGSDLISYIQRCAGYTLTGNTSEQCLFILTGEGSNGKTTLTQAIAEVLGTYYDEMATETLLAGTDRIPTDIAKLVGVRGAFASENEQNRALAEALIKKLTGGESIAARFMRQDYFTFKPNFKIWLHTNHKPRIRGTDHGIWRRIRVIPFNYRFKDAEKIPNYYEQYLRPELPGILNWIVQGCLDWQHGGLREPERVKRAWDDYRKESDSLALYLADNVFEMDGSFLTSASVYRAYCTWARQLGDKPESQIALSKAIAKRFDIEPTVKRNEGRGFYGLYAPYA